MQLVRHHVRCHGNACRRNFFEQEQTDRDIAETECIDSIEYVHGRKFPGLRRPDLRSLPDLSALTALTDIEAGCNQVTESIPVLSGLNGLNCFDIASVI